MYVKNIKEKDKLIDKLKNKLKVKISDLDEQKSKIEKQKND